MRNKLHKEVLELADNNNVLMLQWATGVGKSKMALDLKTFWSNKEKKSLKTLLVVAEIAHKSNWEKEFDKWNISLDDVTMECYASFKNYKNSYWDLIIYDEAHHLGSELRLDILQTINSKYTIFLSATIDFNTQFNIFSLQQYRKYAASNVKLTDAINYGILNEPKIYLKPLILNNTDRNNIVVEEWGKKDLRRTIKCQLADRWTYLKNKRLYPNIRLEMVCTEKQKYDYLSSQYNYWKSLFMNTRLDRVKNKWLQSGLLRKKFLGELKTEYVKKLLVELANKRCICFCNSIEQADELGSNNSIHSKKKNSQKIIEDFNTKKIDKLFAVNMAQEGLNLVDIEIGIIIQLDGQVGIFTQKFGRSMRATDPIQFIFYYENTRDEEYLKNVLEDINPDYIIKL